MESFVDILTKFDKDIKKTALGTILTVLEKGEIEHFTKRIHEAGLLEIIKDLANDSYFSQDTGEILKYFSK